MDTQERCTSEQKKLEDAVAQTLDIVKRKGVVAQISVTKQSGLNINTCNTDLENIEFNKDGTLGICVYAGQRKGVATTNDLTSEALERTVTSALDIAQNTDEDPYASLVEARYLAQETLDLDLYHPWQIDTGQATQILENMARVASKLDKRLKQIDDCSFSSHASIHVLGNSHGFLKSYATSRHALSCTAIAEQDGQMQRDHYYHVNRCYDALFSPETIAQKAVEKTIARLGYRSLKTQSAPVVFSPEKATSLFSHLASAIHGSQLYRKTSFLLNARGEQLFPTWLSITENPHQVRALASAPFDSEGVQTKPCVLIKDGILQSYLLSAYAARRLQEAPTGHSGGLYNCDIPTTHNSQSDLFKAMGTGLYVTELMGHGINLVTGDYSRGASGFWIENGEIAYPVSEITIAGKLRDMFLGIQGISNDPSPNSAIRCGSLWLDAMQIAGQS